VSPVEGKTNNETQTATSNIEVSERRGVWLSFIRVVSSRGTHYDS